MVDQNISGQLVLPMNIIHLETHLVEFIIYLNNAIIFCSCTNIQKISHYLIYILVRGIVAPKTTHAKKIKRTLSLV